MGEAGACPAGAVSLIGSGLAPDRANGKHARIRFPPKPVPANGAGHATSRCQPRRDRRDPRHRLRAFQREAADQPAGGRGIVRVAGADRVYRAADPVGRGRHPGDVERSGRAAQLRQRGHRVPVRAGQPAKEHLRARRAAGDRVLRRAGLDPLSPRHHAAGRALGRRGDRLGHRGQPGRGAGRRGEHLRRPVRKPAGGAALSRRAHARAGCSR